MTKTLEIEMTLGELILWLQHCKEVDGKIPVEIQMAINIVQEYSQYRAMEQRLQKVYGACEGLLEKVVQHLEKHENTELPDIIFKASLLIDDEVDRWEAYKAIGTVEECQKAVEKQTYVCEPEYLGENTAIGCRIGRCRCGNIVRSYHNFCNDCGVNLDWSNVYPGSGDVQ